MSRQLSTLPAHSLSPPLLPLLRCLQVGGDLFVMPSLPDGPEASSGAPSRGRGAAAQEASGGAGGSGAGARGLLMLGAEEPDLQLEGLGRYDLELMWVLKHSLCTFAFRFGLVLDPKRGWVSVGGKHLMQGNQRQSTASSLACLFPLAHPALPSDPPLLQGRPRDIRRARPGHARHGDVPAAGPPGGAGRRPRQQRRQGRVRAAPGRRAGARALWWVPLESSLLPTSRQACWAGWCSYFGRKVQSRK